MKYTLLQMTQDILSSMDSDDVTSITDNDEAMQVARVIRTAYYDLCSRVGFAEHKTVFQLQASSSVNFPVVMIRPDDVQTIEVIKYNKATVSDSDPQFTELTPLSISDFFKRMHSYDLSATNVLSFSYTIDGTAMTVLYYNDRSPSFYTCVNDSVYIFDGYDNTVDTALSSTKTWCFGLKAQDFSLVDSFTPALDEQQFSLLLNEAKALAFAELKQMTHAKAEKTATRQQIAIHKKKHHHPDSKLDYGYLPNYGRK